MFGPIQERNDVLAHRRLEQRLLVLEVEIERPLRDTCALRDVLEPRGGEAVLDEGLKGRVQDVPRPLLGHAPAGRGRLAPAARSAAPRKARGRRSLRSWHGDLDD